MGLLAQAACGVSSLPVVSVTAIKPQSPLTPPANQALIVFVKNNTARGGGWSDYTVFDERGAIVAQFPDDLPPGWTALAVDPGQHVFFIRTYTSDKCQKVVGDFGPSKIYVAGLIYDQLTYESLTDRMNSSADAVYRVRWLVPGKDDPAGPLAFDRYSKIDEATAAPLKASGDVTACMTAASKDGKHPAPAAGLDNAFSTIDFGGSK
jgi:hypothetical protein